MHNTLSACVALYAVITLRVSILSQLTFLQLKLGLYIETSKGHFCVQVGEDDLDKILYHCMLFCDIDTYCDMFITFIQNHVMSRSIITSA